MLSLKRIKKILENKFVEQMVGRRRSKKTKSKENACVFTDSKSCFSSANRKNKYSKTKERKKERERERETQSQTFHRCVMQS
jgi:hypothetical protein